MRSVGPESWLWIVTALAAGAAAISLWFGAARAHVVDRAAYRWLAIAALLWCAGAVGERIMSSQVTGFTAPLTLADLFPLLALVPMATGALAFAIPGSAAIRGPLGSACRSELATQRFFGHVLDSYLLASALVIVGWLSLFGSQYHRSAEDPRTFMLGLARPLADILVVSALLPLVVAVGRRVAAPYLAVIAITVGDAFGAADRLGGGHQPTSYDQIAKIVGYLLLLSAPWLAAAQAARKERGAAFIRGRTTAAIVSVVSAAAAALLIVASEIAGGRQVEPVVILVASGVVLALAGRVLGLLRENGLALAAARASGGHVRDLADRTSDAVLICDVEGAIRYASPSVAAYGYVADTLVGRKLAEFAHPEDRPAWIREIQRIAGDPEDDRDGVRSGHAAAEATGTRAQQDSPTGVAVARFPCRILAADGTWRHIECTVSRYQQPGERSQLLITARDLSDQVALRQQVTHLTFHDRLTGLANRAYFEERVAEVLGQHRRGASTQNRGDAAPAGETADLTDLEIAAIFLHLDHFTAVKDSAGHAAGDLLLTQAARRLRAAVPPQHTLARLAGDEFAVLVEAHSGAKEAVDLAEHLIRCIAAQPFRVFGRDVAVTASVGVAFAADSPAEDVMRNADVAMSRAKASGGDRVEIFAPHMHADMVRRLELSTDVQGRSPRSA